MIVVAGTGHRPHKLGGYSEYFRELVEELALREIARLQPTILISGMALGWDQAIAKAALDLNIPLHAYIPFSGQERMWPRESRIRYNKMLDRANKIHIACEGSYAPWKMQTRNEHMVRDCELLLALWDGTSGGTANCIAYANSVGRSIDNCWDRYIV